MLNNLFGHVDKIIKLFNYFNDLNNTLNDNNLQNIIDKNIIIKMVNNQI